MVIGIVIFTLIILFFIGLMKMGFISEEAVKKRIGLEPEEGEGEEEEEEEEEGEEEEGEGDKKMILPKLTKMFTGMRKKNKKSRDKRRADRKKMIADRRSSRSRSRSDRKKFRAKLRSMSRPEKKQAHAKRRASRKRSRSMSRSKRRASRKTASTDRRVARFNRRASRSKKEPCANNWQVRSGKKCVERCPMRSKIWNNTTKKCERKSCKGGQKVNTKGDCVCPALTNYNTRTKTCVRCRGKRWCKSKNTCERIFRFKKSCPSG